MPTTAMEDYLEKIYLLIKEKGYARTADVASLLDVSSSSATRMIQRLDEMGFLVYEKYRGFILTEKGKKTAQSVAEKHQLLEEFLRMIGVHEENIYQEVEGIEHHISQQTAFCITSLVQFFEDNLSVKESYLKYRKQLADAKTNIKDSGKKGIN